MNGFEAFKIFQAVRLHFTTDSFDYFNYHGKTKASEESFELRKDKYSFHKLARMTTEDELPYYLAVNFQKGDSKMWVSPLITEDASKLFKTWVKWQEARSDRLREDLCKLSDKNFRDLIVSKGGQFPELLNLVFQDELCYDSLVILDHFINLMEPWNKKIEDDFIWGDFYMKFKKYKPFFVSYAPLSEPHYKKVIVESLQLKKE